MVVSPRSSWPPPFEALPSDRATWRRRAVRDGLIISGWLATGFALGNRQHQVAAEQLPAVGGNGAVD